jgi:hypothetical protein
VITPGSTLSGAPQDRPPLTPQRQAGGGGGWDAARSVGWRRGSCGERAGSDGGVSACWTVCGQDVDVAAPLRALFGQFPRTCVLTEEEHGAGSG